MRSMLISVALLAITAGGASAGQFKVEAGPDANPAQYSRIRPITDADITNRWLPALKWNYGQICADDDANPATPCVNRDRTNVEAMNAWLSGVNAGITDIVRRYERHKAATDAVAPIEDLP